MLIPTSFRREAMHSSLQQSLAHSFGLSDDEDSSDNSSASPPDLVSQLGDAYGLSPPSSISSASHDSPDLLASFEHAFGFISPLPSCISTENTDEDSSLKPSTLSEKEGHKDDDYEEPPGTPMSLSELSPEGEMNAAAGTNSIGEYAVLFTFDSTSIVILELYLINPLRLLHIRESLMTLRHGEYVDGIVMDQWLLHQYQQLQQPSPRYIPMAYLLPDGPSLGPDEIDCYRRIYDSLPLVEEGPCEMEDCIGVILVNGNHYCCVMFRPVAREIHILGRTGDLKGKRGVWSAIGSRDVWRKVCLLMGWSLGEVNMRIMEVGLPQNGYDCGPVACQAIMHIWEGLVFEGCRRTMQRSQG